MSVRSERKARRERREAGEREILAKLEANPSWALEVKQKLEEQLRKKQTGK